MFANDFKLVHRLNCLADHRRHSLKGLPVSCDLAFNGIEHLQMRRENRIMAREDLIRECKQVNGVVRIRPETRVVLCCAFPIVRTGSVQTYLGPGYG